MKISLLLSSLTVSTAFLTAPSSISQPQSSVLSVAAAELEEGDVLLFEDADIPVPDFDAMMDEEEVEEPIKKPHSRWKSLNRNTKRGMQNTRQERVVKQRQESKQDKKRRIMFFMKEAERNRKLAARVERKIPLDMRTPLVALKPGTKLSGTVISLTHFGAYVDIGTECDGLLHVSQISNTYFVEHPKEVLQPGEEVQVMIKSLNPTNKKLHLTMLETIEEDDNDDDDDEERILLEDLELDDELWGELVRVTDYGAYVELGAEVRGFLHFMDHPWFGNEPGAHPNTFMSVGDRVRVWVSDINLERERIKLTANRPTTLPGPRRELF